MLFEPDWGQYDMAIGENIVSAFSGPADSDGFGFKYEPPKEKTHQIVYDQPTLKLHNLYENVRSIREQDANYNSLQKIWSNLVKEYPDEWLLPVEIYELIKSNSNLVNLSTEIRKYLLGKRSSIPESALIIDGLLIE